MPRKTPTLVIIVGSGAVYVLDGRDIITTNVAEADGDGKRSVYNVTLHLLAPGEGFDFESRRPIPQGRKRPIEDAQPA